MPKRSIKDSLNDAAFQFVKQGFENPVAESSNLPNRDEENHRETLAKKKVAEVKATSLREARRPTPKKRKSKPIERTVDHLVSVSTRMPSSLFADLKKEALTRQLVNQSPHSIQQILIDAADDWLKRNRS